MVSWFLRKITSASDWLLFIQNYRRTKYMKNQFLNWYCHILRNRIYTIVYVSFPTADINSRQILK